MTQIAPYHNHILAVSASVHRMRLLALLMGVSLCVWTSPMVSHASSLIPDKPSIEVHLEALEHLRSGGSQFSEAPTVGFAQQGAVPSALPFASASSQIKPSVNNNPLARATPQPALVPKPAPQPIAQPAPQPVAVPKPAPQPVAQNGMVLPPPPAPLLAPTDVSKVIVVPKEALPPITLPEPKIEPKADIAASSVNQSALQALAPLAVATAVTSVAAPATPDVSKLNFGQLPKAELKSSPAPVIVPDVKALVPTKEEKTAFSALDEAGKTAPVKTEMLQPKTAPIVAPLEKKSAAPVLSPLPPMPALAKAIEMPPLPEPITAPEKVAPVLVAEKAPAPTLPNPPAPKADPALKNLSERMNSMFVKAPEKQGVIADKTAVTGPEQNMPALPKIPVAPRLPAEKPKQMTLDEVNVIDPPETMRTPIVPAVKPLASPPVVPVPAKDNSAVSQLSKAAANAPTIPVAKPPELPALPAPVQKPVVASDASSKLDFSHLKPADTKPITLTAPIVGEPAAAIKPAPAPTPVKAQIVAPATAPVKPLEKVAAPKMVEKQMLPTIPNAPAKAQVASMDDLASLLPPPTESTVKQAAKEMATGKVEAPFTPKVTEEKALPSLSVLKAPSASAAQSALPSLSALTGDTSRTSADIIRDEQGIRTASIAPPATLPPASSELPKVTRVEADPIAKSGVATKPALSVPERTPALTAAVASPAVPASVPVVPPLPPELSDAPKPASVARSVTVPVLKSGASALSIPFEKDKVDVQQTMQSEITIVADGLKKDGKSVRILAYASGKADEASAARRISLSRALQVRAALISKGVDPMKITVQALGNTQGNSDKADLVVQ